MPYLVIGGDQLKHNYFRTSTIKTYIKFWSSIFIVVLMVFFIFLQYLGRINWGGFAYIFLLIPGIYLFMWSYSKFYYILKANKVLKNLPVNLDKSDLNQKSDFMRVEIGVYIYNNHLFILNKTWFYVMDINKIEWLFISSESSRVQAWDNLVINTTAGERYFWIIPNPSELGFVHYNDHYIKEELVHYLFDYIGDHYPQIKLGYTSEMEKNMNGEQSAFSESIQKVQRFDKDNKWDEFNRNYIRKEQS